MSALDPLCPVFAQLIEVVMIRQNVSKKEAVCRANELIERLGLPKELSKKDRLPSELSGGQCQRILIAMALACNPDVLLCDEPTKVFDTSLQVATMIGISIPSFDSQRNSDCEKENIIYNVQGDCIFHRRSDQFFNRNTIYGRVTEISL